MRVRDSLRLLRLVFLFKNQRKAQANAGVGMVQLHLDMHDSHHPVGAAPPPVRAARARHARTRPPCCWCVACERRAKHVRRDGWLRAGWLGAPVTV